MSRREAREQALAMIFEMNFNDNTVGEMVDNALIYQRRIGRICSRYNG